MPRRAIHIDIGVSMCRQEFGGMKVDHARRLKQSEKENGHLKRAVANRTVDNLFLEESANGNF